MKQPLTRIRELRKAQGLTLTALAAMVGTTPQTVQRLETGNMTVSMEWLTCFAEALKVEPRDLLASRETDPKTADDRFIAAMRMEVISARRKSPGGELSSLALVEEVGQLSTALLDWRSSRVHWNIVVEEAVQVAVMAMRLATEGDPVVGELGFEDVAETTCKLEALA